MPNWVQINDQSRAKIINWVMKADKGVCVAFKRASKRSRDQNDLMWPYLRKIAQTIDWDGHKFDEYQWKDIFTGSLWGGLAVPGIHGGVVFVGSRSTSDLSKEQMTELLESIIAFASENGIFLEGQANA